MRANDHVMVAGCNRNNSCAVSTQVTREGSTVTIRVSFERDVVLAPHTVDDQAMFFLRVEDKVFLETWRRTSTEVPPTD